jgi:hypothetical protein
VKVKIDTYLMDTIDFASVRINSNFQVSKFNSKFLEKFKVAKLPTGMTPPTSAGVNAVATVTPTTPVVPTGDGSGGGGVKKPTPLPQEDKSGTWKIVLIVFGKKLTHRRMTNPTLM